LTIRIKLAIPKGSLEKDTFGLLERALYRVYGKSRTYRPVLSDQEIEVKLLRPQEIPIVVHEGAYDVGITGQDWVKETNVDVETLFDLRYGAVRLVLAAPESTHAASADEYMEEIWSSDRSVRISTEYLNIASKYVSSLPSYRRRFGDKSPLVITPWWTKGDNEAARVYLSFGATEAKPPEEADAILDVVETGTTLQANKLRILDTALRSTTVLIANRESLRDVGKREKIYDILTLLKGVVEAEGKLHIFVNVRKENLNELLSRLPALKRPTISSLSDPNWFSINTIIEKSELFKLLPTLRKLAQGLVVHEPQQILSLEQIGREESNGASLQS
jgi:ATP phosphoribosyltransferase